MVAKHVLCLAHFQVMLKKSYMHTCMLLQNLGSAFHSLFMYSSLILQLIKWYIYNVMCTYYIHEVVECDQQIGHKKYHADRMLVNDFQHYIRVTVCIDITKIESINCY